MVGLLVAATAWHGRGQWLFWHQTDASLESVGNDELFAVWFKRGASLPRAQK